MVEPGLGQDERPTGIEFGALPAVGFDVDEGVGLGFAAEVYQYGDGTELPYEWTVQPRVYVTTRGRRDFTVFFDSPTLLPGGWRVDGFVGYERRVSSPYYGVGNESSYDEGLDDPDGTNPYYYAFGRLRRMGRLNLQRRLGSTPVRLLIGAGLVSNEVDPVPRDEGTTLYASEFGSPPQTYWTNYVRVGLVWDTRDRETASRRGTWTEVIFKIVDQSLGADVEFTQWTVIDRRYFALGERLVLAHRYHLQGVRGSAPVEQLQRIDTSFREGEGLGGSSSLRGVRRNRYTGEGMLSWNVELRGRVHDFRALGRDLYVAASVFLDQGRVWTDGVRLDQLLSDLHRGYGGGLHGGMGENLVASLYAGTSAGTGLQAYVMLGYLF